MSLPSPPIEFVFKKVKDIGIGMDVYLPPGESKVPAVLWIHGGGSRKTVPPHFLNAPSSHSVALISIDYRLAPQVKLPDILSDCLDAINFLSSAKFKKETHSRVDNERLVISGGSAGGWLALLLGYGVGFKECGLTPLKPTLLKGILAIYPITDVEDSFFTEGQKDGVSYLNRVIPKEELAEFLDESAPVVSCNDKNGPRQQFYGYMVQEGIEQDLLLKGTPFSSSPGTFSIASFIRSIDKTTAEQLPPTYVIHGTIDDKVPIRQSTDVVSAFKGIGVSEKVVYEEREGLDHLFDFEEKEKMINVWEWIKDVVAS